MLAEKKKGIKNMSKANLKSYHWETVNDVDFFTNGVVCTDINIKDTVGFHDIKRLMESYILLT